MKALISLVISGYFLIGMGDSTAYGQTVSLTGFECGDHWFSVEVQMDQNSNRATIEMSGDSMPESKTIAGIYEFVDTTLVLIKIGDKGESWIELAGTDADFSNPQGRMTENAGLSFTDLGYCSVN